ncbi:HicB family toxin-antitoxin system [Gordonia sp. NPDC003424]
MLYRIDVTRDDRWWMLRIPALHNTHGLVGEALTQARRYADIPREATDYICVVTDCKPSDVSLDIHVAIDDLDVTAAANRVRELKTTAAQLEHDASILSVSTADRLSAQGIPIRDIGAILGVSHQRVAQLMNAETTTAGTATRR